MSGWDLPRPTPIRGDLVVSVVWGGYEFQDFNLGLIVWVLVIVDPPYLASFYVYNSNLFVQKFSETSGYDQHLYSHKCWV